METKHPFSDTCSLERGRPDLAVRGHVVVLGAVREMGKWEAMERRGSRPPSVDACESHVPLMEAALPISVQLVGLWQGIHAGRLPVVSGGVRQFADGLTVYMLKRDEFEHGSGPLLLCGMSCSMVHQWATATMWPVFVLNAVPEPLFREQQLARQYGSAFALKGDGKFFRARTGAVGHVLQVATGRINSQGESFALFNAQTLPVSFKVHG